MAFARQRVGREGMITRDNRVYVEEFRAFVGRLLHLMVTVVVLAFFRTMVI